MPDLMAKRRLAEQLMPQDVPLPQRPSTVEDLLNQMQSYGASLERYAAPAGQPNADVAESSPASAGVAYDPTPETPYTNADHIIALLGSAGRSLIPGGSRLTANAQSYMAGTDDAADRLSKMNASDDALFADYPIQSTAANMAGLAVPVLGAGRIVGKLAERATHVPAIAGALNTIPGMATIGAGMGVSDEMLDRPDDGNPGLAAILGGVTGGIAGAGRSVAGMARRKFFPNRFEIEDDAWKEIEKLNLERRLGEYKSIASGPAPQVPPSASAPIPQPSAPPQAGGLVQPAPTPTPVQPPPRNPVAPPVSQPAAPVQQPAARPQAPTSAPVPAQQPSAPSPAPSGQSSRYTAKHSSAAMKTVQDLLSGGTPRTPSNDEAKTIATGMQKMFSDMGLGSPSIENITSRLNVTLDALRTLKQSGADIADPKVIALAFGRSTSLAAPVGAASTLGLAEILAGQDEY